MKKTFLIILLTFLFPSSINYIDNPVGLSARHGHASAVLNDKIFVISGSKRLDYLDYLNDYLKKDILYSYDGYSWQGGIPPFGAVGSKALSYNNKIYVSGGMYAIGGTSDCQLYKEIWSSSNGTTWTLDGTLPEGQGRRNHAFVFYNNKFWILGGNKGPFDLALPYSPTNVIQSNDVYSGIAGSLYTQVCPNVNTPDRWCPREGLASVAFQGKLWIFGGAKRYNGGGGAGFEYESLGDVWNTYDGVKWTFIPQKGDAYRWEALGRAFHQVVVLNNSLYLIGGIKANIKNGVRRACNDIQKSTDGIYWSKVAEFPGPRYDHTAVVKGNSIYIIGGRNENTVLNDIVVYTP
jgi:N-acetylneuraminic acid mutarotase